MIEAYEQSKPHGLNVRVKQKSEEAACKWKKFDSKFGAKKYVRYGYYLLWKHYEWLLQGNVLLHY